MSIFGDIATKFRGGDETLEASNRIVYLHFRRHC